MERKQPGAPKGSEQPGANEAPVTKQVTASQSGLTKAPNHAAFGTAGGAAIMFRDLASL